MNWLLNPFGGMFWPCDLATIFMGITVISMIGMSALIIYRKK